MKRYVSPLIEGFSDLFGRFIVIADYIPYLSEPKGPSLPGSWPVASQLVNWSVELRQVWLQSLSSELLG